MKKSNKFFLLLLVLTSYILTGWAQQLRITGKIGGYTDANVTLISIMGDTIASIPAQKGNFVLSAPIQAGLYNLEIGPYKETMFLNPVSISLTGYIDRENASDCDVMLSNMEDNKVLKNISLALEKDVEHYLAGSKNAVKNLPEADQPDATIDYLMGKYDYKALRAIEYSKTISNPAVAAALLLGETNLDYENLKAAYNALSLEGKQTQCGKFLKNLVDSTERSAIGAMAPDFSVVDKNGKTLKLSSLKGKPVVVDFWASWCGPCRKEMAYLKKINKLFDGRVQFLSVSLDDNRDKWLQASEEEQIPWLSYWDEAGFNKSRPRYLYSFNAIPFILVIDRNGRIVAKNKMRIELLKILHNITRTKK